MSRGPLLIALGVTALAAAAGTAMVVTHWERTIDRDTAALPQPGSLDRLVPIHLYAGDSGRYAERSKNYRTLSGRARDAFLVLANAREFSRPVDESGREMPNTAAFNELLGDPHAREAFGELTQSASIFGRLYGLCGLYFLDPSELARRLPAIADDQTTITAGGGCMPWGRSVREFIGPVEALGRPVEGAPALNITSGMVPKSLRWTRPGDERRNDSFPPPTNQDASIAEGASGRPAGR